RGIGPFALQRQSAVFYPGELRKTHAFKLACILLRRIPVTVFKSSLQMHLPFRRKSATIESGEQIMSVAKSSPPEGIPLTDCERRLWLDIAWADQDEEVRAKYAGEWVAVFERRVLAHGQDRAQVLNEAAALTQMSKEE